MSGVNKVIILGRLGKDVELKYTTKNHSVANFSVATSEKWKDKQSGQMNEKTEWHRVVVWGAQGENCANFLRKGSQVYIEGRLETRSWENKNGEKRFTTEVIANNIQFLDAKEEKKAGPQQESFEPTFDSEENIPF